MNYLKAGELSFDPRPQMGGIFVEGFYQWLKYFTKDKEKLTRALMHMFFLDYFNVAVQDDKIAAITACTDGKTPPIKLDKKALCGALGFISGRMAYMMLNKNLVNHLYPFEVLPQTGSIEFVATAPEFRGKGTAHGLISHIIESTSYSEYILEVASNNTSAVRLYEKLGFAEFKRTPAPKEDGDKVESDSITNQRELITNYLKGIPNIAVVSERVDDGFSGASFDRPSFNAMMDDIRAGRVDCVAVKDLSRFGRNYTEAGRYLENVFPFMGVRFLAVNDGIDSTAKKSYGDNIIIPFKNLINDAYCRDISVKIRSQLEIKRKKGDFIGSFAVFGYLKDEKNKNKLIIDEYAAEIVRDIFKWKIEGMSQQGIADRLNSLGILSPYEYKRSLGLKLSTSFKQGIQAKWSAVAVGRILKDEIYVGTLAQGKTSTPNHKVKKIYRKSKEDWVRAFDRHEPIISRDDFELVGSLLLKDMRIAPNENTVYLFSGMLKCADCNENMIRKTVPSGDKKYHYYVCGKSKKGSCKSHSVTQEP